MEKIVELTDIEIYREKMDSHWRWKEPCQIIKDYLIANNQFLYDN